MLHSGTHLDGQPPSHFILHETPTSKTDSLFHALTLHCAERVFFVYISEMSTDLREVESWICE